MLKSGIRIVFVFGLTVLSFSSVAQRDNTSCGITPGQPLTNAYGPFDATNPAHAKKLPLVLGAHFTSDVERLIRGNAGTIIGDIDYTLRAIPNYHRALAAMAKHQRTNGIQLYQHSNYYTADCYFRRAIYFQPADVTARMLFGMHLHLTGRLMEAEKEYQQAFAITTNYAELHYNAGLLYVDLNKLEQAIEHARNAYDLGYPLHGLKNKIKQKGGSL